MQIRQGDLLFISVAAPQSDLRPASRVLARGEATGHAHILTGAGEVMVGAGKIYVRTAGQDVVVHEEHRAVDLSAAPWWEVRHQRIYDPSAERAVRPVRD
jgi:hypothetical protein